MAESKNSLEKLRSDAFFEMMGGVSKRKPADVEARFKKADIKTYHDFLAAVERHSRDVFFQHPGNTLERASGEASLRILQHILDRSDVEVVEGFYELRISHLNDISTLALTRAMEQFEKKTGRTSLESARPTARGTYVAMQLDMWPDSPAAIADFWLTDQEHYEALYYPIRAAEITVEDLDRVLGDAKAITQLVNASPSNPHRGIVFGEGGSAGADATLNGIGL